MVPAAQAGENLLNAWFQRDRVREQEQKIREKADAVIDFSEELIGDPRLQRP